VNRRLLGVVLAAAAIAVLIAVPALGRDAVAPTFDRKASAGALAKATRALNQARQARRLARRAGDRAGEAQARANGAIALAEEDRSQLNATRSQLQSAQAELEALKKQVAGIKPSEGAKIVSATAPGLVTSSAVFGEYEALGGPSVQVTVPDSGLIEVWAQVGIEEENGGAVGLYEDGQKVTGISAAELCGDPEPTGVRDGSALIDVQEGLTPGEFVAAATPPTPGFPLGCANAGAPAPVLLSRPAGPHTYELRYSETSCPCNPGGGAEFRDRVLRVAPRP
jgi:hypothetical protein